MKPKFKPRFPPISKQDVERLARSPSYYPDDSSGRCLIALRESASEFDDLVMVRNCFVNRGTGASSTVTLVENMRDRLPDDIRAKHPKSYVKLPLLEQLGFKVEKAPFKLIEPMHNCILDLTFDEFTEALALASLKPTAGPATETDNETPMLRLLNLHWREARLETWTPLRVRKLAAMWGLTTEELAGLIQWNQGRMNHFLTPGIMAGYRLPGPVAVWFQFLESFRFGETAFPSLSGESSMPKAS